MMRCGSLSLLSKPRTPSPQRAGAQRPRMRNGSKIYECPGSAQPLLQKAQPLHLHTPQWFLAFSGLQNGLQASTSVSPATVELQGTGAGFANFWASCVVSVDGGASAGAVTAVALRSTSWAQKLQPRHLHIEQCLPALAALQKDLQVTMSVSPLRVVEHFAGGGGGGGGVGVSGERGAEGEAPRRSGGPVMRVGSLRRSVVLTTTSDRLQQRHRERARSSGLGEGIATIELESSDPALSHQPISRSVVSVATMMHESIAHDGGGNQDEDALNARARAVLRRVRDKLVGEDFAPEPLNVPTQVERLIAEARSNSNLCQLYVGWCAFW
mmetsp:Transcript_26926/g.80535  ORF Transcript_26926/g.80535 Transcript_26926/m.80535 type:complete len:326 (+) Transcript_26926:96-1073(+)